jgi:hypothetical protein
MSQTPWYKHVLLQHMRGQRPTSATVKRIALSMYDKPTPTAQDSQTGDDPGLPPQSTTS